MSWNTSTVQIGHSTKKSDYDRLLENEKVIASSSFTINGNKIFKDKTIFSSTAIVSKGNKGGFALFTYEKTSGVNGSLIRGNIWGTCSFNTEIYNKITGCILTSNRFILSKGSYFLRYDVQSKDDGFISTSTKTRIRNKTLSSTLAYSFGIIPNGSVFSSYVHSYESIIKLSTTSTICIQIFCRQNHLEGIAATSDSGIKERYSQILIEKIYDY